ncbi:tripartite tricarboxylate transporter permease [Cuneatibacter sp. NSJ-177]|uniref:tripartite tricarboxylate transporter permease n=1 Tax=Cuneatibacter sp. NSJ-177 TaxID=2931401 RepID=UPI001FD554C0|nr:tripartite tricarboxylate transporter permease [Cuneatibacter sp. NSJ-177]MCJ7836724.1 tripartite tricarboxylate transporter permease [Cuneatibacter sp. NSJ-177]
MENLAYMLIPFQQPMLILLIAAGVFLGIYIGAIPGLSATMAISLLVSFTFGWDTNAALAIMMGIHCGVVYGGSRSAILLNIPGAPAAVATALDGYPLAKKGLAGQAIGITTVSSVIGGFIGVVALAVGAPLISKLALKFAPRDYLLLAFMGLMLVGSLGTKSAVKGFISATIGVTLGMVGMDPISGVGRFTFDNVYLLSGIDYVTALIGLFGVSEVLCQVLDREAPVVKQKVDKIVPSFKTVLKYFPLTVRSSIVGVLVGALPGAGGDLSALITYDQAKRTVKNPEVPFGEGAIEGLIAPESANNATIGGAFIPMLTLGIPGDAVTAVMIGALTIHGLKPGPMLMTDTPHLFYYIVMSFVIANIFLLIFGLTGVKIFTKIVEIPKGILFPAIVILSVVGSYAINNSLYDIFWMLGFGVLGYILKRYDYPVAPAVLGIILAELIETNYRRAIILEKTIPNLLLSFFKHPISIVLVLIIAFMFLSQSKWYKAWRDRKSK